LQFVRKKHGPQFCQKLAAAIYPGGVMPGAEKSAISQYLEPPKKTFPPKRQNGKAAAKAAAAGSQSSHAPEAVEVSLPLLF